MRQLLVRIFLMLFCLMPCISWAQQADAIKIGVFWDNRPSSAKFTGRSGSYAIFADGAQVETLSPASEITLTITKKGILLRSNHRKVGYYHNIQLKAAQHDASVAITPLYPLLEPRKYEGSFNISNKSGRLKIINHVRFDQYLAGVVQSEAGNKHTLEFYKVQAIICRTYALKHYYKFKQEGFNLCDRVDSQVYKTMGWNDTIRQAVSETKDIVIVDSDINLISAVFHSNSGGATINSEDLWVQAVPYLRAVKDTFSVCQPHYDWLKAIHTNEYLGYFAQNYQIDTSNTEIKNQILFYTPPERKPFYFAKDEVVPLRKFRSDFQLSSTAFHTGLSADSVIIVGRGFGHGVGLSQEGAMLMAELGYSYTDILHHYYQNIHLIKLSVIDFFKD